MEGRDLAWFQTLKIAKYSSFTMLAKDFVTKTTKSGLINNVLNQIHQFLQGSSKIVRDFANRLLIV